MSIEIVLMIVALLLMIATIVAKVLTQYLMRITKAHLAGVHHKQHKARSMLLSIRTQHQVAEKRKNSLTHKSAKLKQKIARLKREIKVSQTESQHRELKRKEQKKKLMH